MTARRPFEDDLGSITPLTDLAATILTLLILILIVTLSFAGADASRSAPPKPIALNRREPIGAAELVDALHRRQRRGPGPLIEVHRDTVRVIEAEGAAELPLVSGRLAEDARAALAVRAAAGPGLPLVFVFDQRSFPDVARGLVGLAYRDLTVPAALRDCRPAPVAASPERPGADCARGDEWSAGFLGLGAAALDEAAFRRALAALLDADADSRAAHDEKAVVPPSVAASAALGRPVPVAALVVLATLAGLALEGLLARRRAPGR